MKPTADGAVRWRPVSVHAVSGLLYRPEGDRHGWLVWAHGGSWTAGSAAGWHEACADLASIARCTVFSVDYRLAPDHPHPAALNDILAALDWVETQAGAAPVGVGGDSAGATIAACAALVRRDRARELALQVLAYPPVDPRCAAASYHALPGAFPDRAWMLTAWRQYRGNGDAVMPYSTPLESVSLRGVAPAILGFGGLDPLADDARQLVRRLRRDGCPVTVREFPDLGHGAFLLPSGTHATRNPLRRWLGTTTRTHFSEPPAGETRLSTGRVS